MNLKTSKSYFKKENYESKSLSSLLHHQLSRKFVVAFGLNKKNSQLWRTFMGGGKVYLNLFYLDDNAKLDSKI